MLRYRGELQVAWQHRAGICQGSCESRDVGSFQLQLQVLETTWRFGKLIWLSTYHIFCKSALGSHAESGTGDLEPSWYSKTGPKQRSDNKYHIYNKQKRHETWTRDRLDRHQATDLVRGHARVWAQAKLQLAFPPGLELRTSQNPNQQDASKIQPFSTRWDRDYNRYVFSGKLLFGKIQNTSSWNILKRFNLQFTDTRTSRTRTIRSTWRPPTLTSCSHESPDWLRSLSEVPLQRSHCRSWGLKSWVVGFDFEILLFLLPLTQFDTVRHRCMPCDRAEEQCIQAWPLDSTGTTDLEQWNEHSGTGQSFFSKHRTARRGIIVRQNVIGGYWHIRHMAY